MTLIIVSILIALTLAPIPHIVIAVITERSRQRQHRQRIDNMRDTFLAKLDRMDAEADPGKPYEPTA